MLPALIGRARKGTLSCSEFTPPRSSRKRNSTPICTAWRKPSAAITANSVRSPAEERELVALTVAEAVDHLVAAINGRNLRELNTILINDPGGVATRRQRFLQLIKEYGPRATLDNIDEAIVGEDRARAPFTVSP